MTLCQGPKDNFSHECSISTKSDLKTSIKTLLKYFALDELCSKAKHLNLS